MSQPPAPRYRVVEEGRRLVVIDNWASGGRPVSVTRSQPESASADPPGGWGVAKETGFGGRTTIVTHRFYDARGPRTVRLKPGSTHLTKAARWVIVGSIALVLAAILVSPWVLLVPLLYLLRYFEDTRTSITRWLDAVERDTG